MSGSIADKQGRLTQADVDSLLRRTEVLAAGLSNMWGVYLTPGSRWQANVETGEMEYDLGMAAVLDHDQQTGVALHEVAHFRYTDAVKIPMRMRSGRDERWAQFTYNLFEDCRIERRLRAEFPGSQTALGKLRAAFNRPHMAAMLAYSEPHMQFLNGLYAIIFEDQSWTSDKEVAKQIEDFRVEALDLRESKSSPALMKGLCREDGIVDTLIKLRDEHEPDWGPLAVDGDEEAAEEALERAANEAAEAGSEGDDDALAGVGPEAADGEDAPAIEGDDDAPGDVPAEAGGEGGAQAPEGGPVPVNPEPDDGEFNATVPDPDEFMGDGSGPVEFEDGDDGGGVKPGSDDLRGREDEDDEDDLDGGGSGMGASATAPGGESAGEHDQDDDGIDLDADDLLPSERELAGMTDQQREWLEEMLRNMPASGMEPENFEPMDEDLLQPPGEAAEEVTQRLDGGRRMVGDIGNEIRRVLSRREVTADDRLFDLRDDEERYDAFWAEVSEQGSVLGRQLESVLTENRFDRWSAIGYESGGRLHAQNMARVPARERAIFKRKTRAKNRQFAVAVLQDVSVSMDSTQMRHATLAGVLVAEGLHRAAGVEFAYYAFSSQTACLKPYEFSLNKRMGKIGALGTLQSKTGGGTEMADALSRAGADMVERFGGPDWKRVVIVVTDGQPNDVGRTQAVIRELAVKYDVHVIGIGIKTPGQLAKLFPVWVKIDDARDLGGELVRVLRRTIRKG